MTYTVQFPYSGERNRFDFRLKPRWFCSFVHWEQTYPAMCRLCTKPQWGEEILDMTINYTNPEEGK